jgi:hypothetical protein
MTQESLSSTNGGSSSPSTGLKAFSRPSFKKPRQPLRLNNSSEEATALAQLSQNLTMSVPLLFLESTFFIVSLILRSISLFVAFLEF